MFIAHNSSNYDAHFILSYVIINGEYPEILGNGGKLLEMKIKTRNAKLIVSCCFIAMSFSRFSDTFNIPHTKGAFLHMFNVYDKSIATKCLLSCIHDGFVFHTIIEISMYPSPGQLVKPVRPTWLVYQTC